MRFSLQNYIDLIARHEFVEGIKDDLRAEHHGLLRGEGDVGGDDGVGGVEEGMIDGNRRLHLEDVDTRAGDASIIERVGQCLGVHHGAAGNVDEQGGLLHHDDALFIEHSACGIVEGAV